MSRIEELNDTIADLGGMPILVRPSYVLSGAAMHVANDPHHLENYLSKAAAVSPDHPVVLTKFEQNSKEIEIDAVADQGKIILWAISEHVENAGVHSGDATLVLPPQKLYLETVRRIKIIAKTLARRLSITGPFNMQFLARSNTVKVIELNLRASRSVPFVSKVTGVNFIREATRRMLGVAKPIRAESLDLDYVGVKAAQFSFSRLRGADPTLGVEMVSTGEVGCFGENFHDALLKALISTGIHPPKRGVLLSLGPVGEKYRFFDQVRALAEMGLTMYATPGTADVLSEEGIPVIKVGKRKVPVEPMAVDILDQGLVDLVVNIPRDYDEEGRPDGYLIRRRACDLGIPLITNMQLAMALVEAMEMYKDRPLSIAHWGEYLERRP
jgi:carbamoyl-phosphate synthase large subunit